MQAKFLPGRQARRSLLPVLACSAAVVLSSCSAGPVESTDSGSTNGPAPSTSSAAPATEPVTPPAPSAGTTDGESGPVLEPLPPASKHKPYPPQELALSEKGTRTQSYILEGGLGEDELLTIAAAAANCSPDEKVAIRTNPSVLNVSNLDCENLPLEMNRLHPPEAAIPVLEVTVETSAGASFWVQARVYSGADSGAKGSGQ